MKCFYKKSQSAMEFLMTYGWVLLAVLTVIASLIYFGVLDPETYLPEKVELKEGLDIVDVSVDENSISFILRNDLGRDVYDFQLNATECGGGVGSLSETINIPEGKIKKITVYCEHDYAVGSKIDSELEATWKTRTSTKGQRYDYDHTTTGMMKVTVNEGKELYDRVDVTGCGTLNLTRTIYSQINNINQTEDENCIVINASNIVLDCDGYYIASNYNRTGVSSDQNYTTIENCNISMADAPTGVGTGISMTGNHGLVRNNTLQNQSWGIKLTSSSVDNFSITNNTFADNLRGLYLSIGTANITNNIFTGFTAQAISLMFSNDNYIANNYIDVFATAYYHSSSNRNTFVNNTIVNVVYGILLTGTNGQKASNNTFINENISNVSKVSVYFNHLGSGVTINNTFINCTYENETVDSASQLIRKWYYKAYVNDTGGNALSLANVTAYNTFGGVDFSALTGDDGWTNTTTITEYVNNAGTKSYYNNYTINVTHPTFVFSNVTYNVSAVQNKLDNAVTIGGLNQCGILNQVNKTYALTTSLSTTGDCFAVIGANITVDLNGYNITATQYSEGREAFSLWGGSNVTIKNGYLYDFGNAIIGSPLNSNITNLTIIANADFGMSINDGINGIHFQGGSGNHISNVYTSINNTDPSYGSLDIYSLVSSNNVYADNVFSGVEGSIALMNSPNITILNSSYGSSKITVFGSSQLFRKWYYKAYVNDSGGNAVSGAYVTGYNTSSALIFNATTGINGWTAKIPITEYVNNSGTVSYYSNYTINATNGSLSGARIGGAFNVSVVNNTLTDTITIS